MGKLTALQITRTKKAGFYGDGGNLYLKVTPSGTKSWVFRFKIDGKSRMHGLGSVDTVTLAEARDKALECRRALLDGLDPIIEKEKHRITKKLEAARAMTFSQCAESYIETHKAGWKNQKHSAQWSSTLYTYAYPVIGDLPVGDVDTALIIKILKPIWTDKTETARRLRGRMEKILDWARVSGYREGENPARWKGNLEMTLPAPSKVSAVHHYPALPHAEIKDFWQELSKREGTSAQALRFTILTAVRSSETLNATWDEVDFEQKVWTIPAERMKAGKSHRVPLSKAAISILQDMKMNRQNDFIFPGNKAGKPLSNMSMTTVLRKMGRGDIKTHGFRSTFRDWAAELSGAPREVAEHALAHKLIDKVEAAYFRSDLFEKRKTLMEDWARYCTN